MSIDDHYPAPGLRTIYLHILEAAEMAGEADRVLGNAASISDQDRMLDQGPNGYIASDGTSFAGMEVRGDKPFLVIFAGTTVDFAEHSFAFASELQPNESGKGSEGQAITTITCQEMGLQNVQLADPEIAHRVAMAAARSLGETARQRIAARNA